MALLLITALQVTNINLDSKYISFEKISGNKMHNISYFKKYVKNELSMPIKNVEIYFPFINHLYIQCLLFQSFTGLSMLTILGYLTKYRTSRNKYIVIKTHTL